MTLGSPVAKDSKVMKTLTGFAPSSRAGCQLDEAGTTVRALRGFPKEAFGPVYGAIAVDATEDVISFGFSVLSNAAVITSTEIVVGVADASVPQAKGGLAYGFHVGRSRLCASSDGNKLRKSTKSLSVSTPRRLSVSESGRVNILAVVDTRTHRLAIAVNEEAPVDTGFSIPPKVRPWVWLGGPGVGEVTLAEYRITMPPPSSRGLGVRPPLNFVDRAQDDMRMNMNMVDRVQDELRMNIVDRAPDDPKPLRVDLSDISHDKNESALPSYTYLPSYTDLPSYKDAPFEAGAGALDALPVGAKPKDGSDAPSEVATDQTSIETDRSSRDLDLGDEPAEWTARGAKWLQPLQQWFNHQAVVNAESDVRQVV